MSETLFAAGRRRRGQAEALLSKTMRAWNDEGILAGDSWASARGVLRDAARAVDAARADMLEGEGSAYSFARTNELFRAAMASYRDGGEVGGGDDVERWLAGLSGAEMGDSA